MPKQPTVDRRINSAIKASEIRVIDSEGHQLGIMKVADALEKARREKLDLVEIAPDAQPPVCRIVNFNKLQFEEKKKAKEIAKKNREARIEVKELWLRPVTDKHDLEVKVRHAQEFLKDGNKVKFIVKFRGREISHVNQGRTLLETVIELLGDVKIDQPITQSGKQLLLVVSANVKK